MARMPKERKPAQRRDPAEDAMDNAFRQLKAHAAWVCVRAAAIGAPLRSADEIIDAVCSLTPSERLQAIRWRLLVMARSGKADPAARRVLWNE